MSWHDRESEELRCVVCNGSAAGVVGNKGSSVRVPWCGEDRCFFEASRIAAERDLAGRQISAQRTPDAQLDILKGQG